MRAERASLICTCGGEVAIWHGGGGSGRYHYAECYGCGAKTSHQRTRQRAEWAWLNRKTPPPRGFIGKDEG